MFNTKEKIKRLEKQVRSLETYCSLLEKEQDEMYIAIIKGLKLEMSEITNMNKEFYTAKNMRRKAFEAFHDQDTDMNKESHAANF